MIDSVAKRAATRSGSNEMSLLRVTIRILSIAH